MRKKVKVLIVTFNRKNYLTKLLRSLSCSLYPIQSILIIDNNSSDGTSDALYSDGIINAPLRDTIVSKVWNNIIVDYYLNSENEGGAGGFSKGFDILQKQNFDFLWVMDDDVLPDENCLTQLIESIDDEHCVTIPNRSDNNYIDNAKIKLNLSNPFSFYLDRKVPANSIRTSTIEVENMPFEGPLIKKSVIDAVGIPDKSYFIFFDDTDYATRILKYTKILFVKNAILCRQRVQIKLNSFNWRDFYSFRNSVYFDKKYGKNVGVKYLRPFIRLNYLIFKSLLTFKFNRIPCYTRAYLDGVNSKMGKTVIPS